MIVKRLKNPRRMIPPNWLLKLKKLIAIRTLSKGLSKKKTSLRLDSCLQPSNLPQRLWAEVEAKRCLQLGFGAVGLKGFLGKGFPKGASFQQETPLKYSAGRSCVYHLALSCAYHTFWLKNFSNTFLDSPFWRMLSKRPAVSPPDSEPPAKAFRKEMAGFSNVK